MSLSSIVTFEIWLTGITTPTSTIGMHDQPLRRKRRPHPQARNVVRAGVPLTGTLLSRDEVR
jgi:hypothetical protein